jgi:ZIP family zinc transporter
MVAASFLSLLAPARNDRWRFFAKVMPAAFGFPGALFGIDKVPHLHINFKISEGIKSPWQRTTLLVSAITLFQGLAVGVLLVESNGSIYNHWSSI